MIIINKNYYKGKPYFKSDEEWQEYFKFLKETVTPSSGRNMKTYVKDNSLSCYDGETQFTRYKRYINGVLSAIRRRKIDYAYYIYQIEDLLRFEPHLKTKYVRDPIDEEFTYFEVWL